MSDSESETEKSVTIEVPIKTKKPRQNIEKALASLRAKRAKAKPVEKAVATVSDVVEKAVAPVVEKVPVSVVEKAPATLSQGPVSVEKYVTALDLEAMFTKFSSSMIQPVSVVKKPRKPRSVATVAPAIQEQLPPPSQTKRVPAVIKAQAPTLSRDEWLMKMLF
jgi:hypothetical protein